MQEILKLIKEIILNTAKKYNIQVDKIILFGSRAKGNYREDSDWDILIVIKNKVNRKKLNSFWGEIEKKLVYSEIIPEIIVIDKDTFEKYKRPAYVFHYAEKEGIIIR